MRILALIPARGGSKRLPGKNVRVLGGKPLITWSIDVVRGLEPICATLVSTDDVHIAAAARSAGAEVPWMRPPALATDSASSVDVCLHALDWYEQANGKIDGLLLLQPTSPLRRRSTVARAIALFGENGGRPVLGVAPAASHPMWCFRIEDQRLRPFSGDGEGLRLRSQDLPPAFVINGALYLISPGDLRTSRSFYTPDAVPLVMDAVEENIDIDTEWDWRMAEMALARAESCVP